MSKMKDKMKERGMTLIQIRAATGINIATLSRVSQDNANPKYSDAVKIATALGVKPEELWQTQS